MSDLVRNERTKLLANALDRASTATLVVGVIAPVAAWGYGSGAAAPDFSLPLIWLFTILWVTMAAILHGLAQFVLGRLK